MVITVGRKPFSSSVSDNVIETSCGAININGCRIGKEKRTYKGSGTSQMRYADHRAGLTDGRGKELEFSVEGRFPANLVYDEKTKDTLDQQGGWRKTGAMSSMPSSKSSIFPIKHIQISHSQASEGFVSRYFKEIQE